MTAGPIDLSIRVKHALGILLFCLMAAGCEQADSHGRLLQSRYFSEVIVIGARGVAPGQFNKPRSVACDRQDNLYVVDMTGRVQKFSPEGQFLLQWQMPQTDLGKPKGMGLDRDGNIIVVEPHYQRINHFDVQGRLVSQWGKKGTNLAEFILPRCIAQNSKGDYFVGEYTLVERVQRFNSRHEFLSSWGAPGLAPGQFNRAEGIAAGPKDSIYVCDSCNHRVQVFDVDGHFIRAHGGAGGGPGQFSYPYDIKVEPDGTQFVCEFGNSRISLFNDKDELIEVIGGPGASPGEFSNPWSIAFNSQGDLYVADSQNHRVQKLVRRHGKIAAQPESHQSPLAGSVGFAASSASVRP